MAFFPDDPSKIEVGIAFGADISADPNTLTYTTISSTVQPEIVITRGRINDSSITQPSTIDMVFLDANGVYSPRNINGIHYGQLRRNTPVRVRVDTGSGLVTRATGYIPSWSPEWIGPNMGDKIRLQAAGVMRRIGQSQDARSALRRTLSVSGAPAYWPLEDGAGATQAVSGLPGGPALTGLRSGVAFGAQSGAAGSLPFVTYTSPIAQFDHVGFAGSIDLKPYNLGGTKVSVGYIFAAFLAPTPHPTNFEPISIITDNGLELTLPTYAGYVSGARTATHAIDMFPGAAGGSTIINTPAFDPFDGLVHSVLATWQQVGADIQETLVVDGTQMFSVTKTSTTMGTPQTLYLGLSPGGTLDSTADDNTGAMLSLGHVTVWGNVTPTDPYQASIGYAGELAATRVTRLCTEEGILVDVASGNTEAMGPQPPDTTFNLLRECESSDEATLVDRRLGKLGFDPTATRYNQTADLTLDYNTQIANLIPSDDDRDLVNDVTVTRVGGSSSRFQQTTGPLSVDPVTGVDEYQLAVSRSLAIDDQARHHAAWLVNIGTTDEPRYVVNLNLRQHKELITQWLACDIGARVVINNPPVIHTGPAPLDLVIEGYQELIDAVRWEVTLWCLPYLPYEAYQVANGTNNRSRVPQEPGGTTVNTQRSPTDTSFAVTSAHVRWIDSATFGSQFPILVICAGEVMSCTAITGTTLSQTMTMTRAVYGTAKTIPAGSEVQLWRAPVTAL